MVIDLIENAHRYYALHNGIRAALEYLETSDLDNIDCGRYPINGDKLFAIVQENDTVDMAGEQMETHRKYIDIQYVVSGEEQVGLALFNGQTISRPYDADEDYMLYADAPSFFTKFTRGMFMIFFPTDLHMPGIKTTGTGKVRKVVVKVAVEE